MVTIYKHAQNHDGRLIVATFLHPKNKFFCHSNKISHFGHVTLFWYCMFYTALGAKFFLEPHRFCGVASTLIGWPFAKILQRSGFANSHISGWKPYL